MAGSGVFPKTGSGSGGTDLIYKNDYNTIQTAVAAVKTTYYGVACTSSQLGSGSITAATTEWNNLKTDLDDCYTHITGTATAIGTKTSGTLITATNSNAYSTAADYITTNKDTAYAATQLTLVSGASSSRSTGWNTSITHQVRVIFSSSASAQYFFNCGGYFRVNTSASGGTGGTKNTNWASAINSVGNWTYARADYAAGNKSTDYNVTSYSSSKLTISCVYESATSLLFTMYFYDGTVGFYDEIINLNISSNLSYYKSTGAIVSPIPLSFTTTSNL